MTDGRLHIVYRLVGREDEPLQERYRHREPTLTQQVGNRQCPIKAKGMRVLIGTDGAAALDLLDQLPPDLILIDAAMPRSGATVRNCSVRHPGLWDAELKNDRSAKRSEADVQAA